MNEGMPEVLGLVNEGKPIEATAAIQRKLRGFLVRQVAPDVTALPADAPIARGCERVGAEPVAPPVAAAPETPVHKHVQKSNAWRQLFARLPRSSAPAQDLTHALEPGARFITDSYTDRVGTRSFKLYIPSSYRGQALPLIVMLHGCKQNPDDFAAGTRMNTVAEEDQCFVLYPAQAAAANPSHCWNWFRASHQKRDQGEPALIAGITRRIIGSYCIDVRRVYCAGLSAGGAMAVVMGVTYPDLYAAIGVHSGLPYGAAHDIPSAFAAMSHGAPSPKQPPQDSASAETSSRSVPTIVFHGDRDTKVHPRNADQVIAQWTAFHRNVARGLRVSAEHGQVPDGRTYTRHVHRRAQGASMFEQWHVHGAGHAWSGGSPIGSYTDPRGPDATREMMRFFHEHPLPEPSECDLGQMPQPS